MARIIISTMDKFKSMATIHYSFHFFFFSFRFRSETYSLSQVPTISLCAHLLFFFSLRHYNVFISFFYSSPPLPLSSGKSPRTVRPPLFLSSVKSPWRLFPPWHLFFMTPLLFPLSLSVKSLPRKLPLICDVFLHMVKVWILNLILLVGH